MPRKTRKRGKRDRRGRGNKRTYIGGTLSEMATIPPWMVGKVTSQTHKDRIKKLAKSITTQGNRTNDVPISAAAQKIASTDWRGGGKRTRKRSRTKRKKTKTKMKTRTQIS